MVVEEIHKLASQCGHSHSSVTGRSTNHSTGKTCSCGIKWCIYDVLGLKPRIKILCLWDGRGEHLVVRPSSMSGQRRKSETSSPLSLGDSKNMLSSEISQAKGNSHLLR